LDNSSIIARYPFYGAYKLFLTPKNCGEVRGKRVGNKNKNTTAALDGLLLRGIIRGSAAALYRYCFSTFVL